MTTGNGQGGCDQMAIGIGQNGCDRKAMGTDQSGCERRTKWVWLNDHWYRSRQMWPNDQWYRAKWVSLNDHRSVKERVVDSPLTWTCTTWKHGAGRVLGGASVYTEWDRSCLSGPVRQNKMGQVLFKWTGAQKARDRSCLCGPARKEACDRSWSRGSTYKQYETC